MLENAKMIKNLPLSEIGNLFIYYDDIETILLLIRYNTINININYLQ